MDEKYIAASLIAAADENIDAELVYGAMETPPDRRMGDLAFPCFRLARTLPLPPE